jgi:hypothetical protein
VLADEIVFSGVAGRVAFARRDGVPVSPSSTAPVSVSATGGRRSIVTGRSYRPEV